MQSIVPHSLLGNNHEVVDCLVEDQKLTIAIVYLATSRVLGDKTQGIVVGQLFIVPVYDLK